MKPSVYIENSIISYLTSEPSRDVVIAARQAVTRTWWSERRFEYELYVSRFVIAEASAGDRTMAAKRLDALAGITEIEVSESAETFANRW